MSVANFAATALVSAVYVSCVKKAPTREELAKLLAQARENNNKTDVTGLLLYRNCNFMQLLEGPAQNVNALLKSLAGDERHSGMIVLTKKQIDERHFSQWQMAFRDLDQLDLKKLEGYSTFMDWSFNALEFQKKPDLSSRLLLQFKDRLF